MLLSVRPRAREGVLLELLPRLGPPIVDFVRPSIDFNPPAKDDVVAALTFPEDDPF